MNRYFQSEDIAKYVKIKSYNKVVKQIDSLWENKWPIILMSEAFNELHIMQDIIKYIDVHNNIDIFRMTRLYTLLNYIEDFLNESIVQNTLLSSYYADIKEYLHWFESGKRHLRIYDVVLIGDEMY